MFLCEINAFDAEFFETSSAGNQLWQGDPSGTRESSVSQADVVILACVDQVCVSSPDLRNSSVGLLTQGTIYDRAAFYLMKISESSIATFEYL